MRVLLVSANRERLPSCVVPLGVLAVAGAVRDAHDVSVLDLCFEERPLVAIEERVRSFEPDVIGLGLRNLQTSSYSGVAERLLGEYRAMAAAIRAASRAPLVLGGAGFSLRATTLLAELQADHGVVGEGEWAFRDLLAKLVAGGAAPKLTYGAAYAKTPLDALPEPARDLVDPRYYALEGTDNVQTKRGCAFDCAYCAYPELEGSEVRFRDPERVASELLQRAAIRDVSCVFLVDAVFNTPRSHALEVCDAIARRGSPVPWVCYASPATLDEELAAAMARAGCVGAEIGSDSGNERVLARLRKPFKVERITRAEEALRRHGIRSCHTFLLGAEGETPDETATTLRFVEALQPTAAVFMAFTEDREDRPGDLAPHRAAILELLRKEAPKHPTWVVPELGIRFGEKVSRIVARRGLRGPSWLHLARMV